MENKACKAETFESCTIQPSPQLPLFFQNSVATYRQPSSSRNETSLARNQRPPKAPRAATRQRTLVKEKSFKAKRKDSITKAMMKAANQFSALIEERLQRLDNDPTISSKQRRLAAKDLLEIHVKHTGNLLENLRKLETDSYKSTKVGEKGSVIVTSSFSQLKIENNDW